MMNGIPVTLERAKEALARYQRDAGIQVTGVIDPKTLAALGFC